MINLIPPSLKEDFKYARWNAILVRYLVLGLVVVVLLGAGFLGTFIYLKQRVAETDASLEDKRATVETYRSTVKAAKEINERVAAIKTIQKKQPKFSLLLDDIAKFTLKGTSITNIALTGDDKKPVQITAKTTSFVAGVSLRDALAASPRISGADISSVGNDTVVILIGFKPGRAR